jgi:RNA polymerase sigma factor (sigma-70 family)
MSEASWPAIVAHRERLLAIARRRCPTYEDAEDVVHEAMLRCATFTNLDESRLGQFLTTVTIRLCVDVYRAGERSSRAVSRLAPDRDVTPSPEEAACGNADARYIEGLIATLPTRQRDVLVDRARGLSMSQIATRHALSYKAAESALARARGTLRGALASALGALALLAASLRRHRLAEVAAAPVAALAVAGFVLHGPFVPASPRLTDLPRGRAGASGAAAANAEPLLRRTPMISSAAAPRPPRRRLGPVAFSPAVAPLVRPKPPREVLVVADGTPVKAEVTDGRHEDEPTETTLYRCLNEGVWVEVDGDVSDGFVPYQGCGQAPHHH